MNIESVIRNLKNNIQQKKRLDFYVINGFADVCYQLYEDRGVDDIFSSNTDFDLNDCMDSILRLEFGNYDLQVVKNGPLNFDLTKHTKLEN